MRKILLASTLLGLPLGAYAQTTGSGTINGLQYLTLTSPGGCSAANPCQIITYLHYLGGESQTAGNLQTYFNTPQFWASNQHTIILAPLVNGSSDTNNWGGVQEGMSPNMQAAIALVKQTEATVPTMTNNVVVTGGSMGGIGTEAAMVEAGPKGTVEPGVFASGLSYDGALYNSDAQAAATALCGVPFTMAHGTSDTSVPYQFDSTLASKLSGCPGFKFVPIQGAAHGTWSNGSSGMNFTSGTLLDPVLDAARSGSTPTASVSATEQLSAATVSTAPQATSGQQTTAPETITPGQGSLTDCHGTVWTITPSGSVMSGGKYTPGGGGTKALSITGCAVSGQDNGHGPVNPGGWFTFGDSAWQVAQAPVAPASALTDRTASLPPMVCGNGVASGAFKVATGRIIGPDGKDYIARGINIYDSQFGDADAMIAMFPGLNFIRVSIGHDGLHDPSFYQAFIAKMTSQGRVVELEHHPDGGGGQDAPYQGAQLASESAWYASVAAAFKSNPYVWFGTFNEPGVGASGQLSAWHKATYDAIRGTGNQNPILIEPGGSRPPNLVQWLVPSVYASMTNIIMDPHVYGYQVNDITDQATNDANVTAMIAAAQTIKSADGTPAVIIAEYGNSTDGTNIDPNGDNNVQAVVNVGAKNIVGSAAWHWLPGGNADHLQNDGKLTDPYGNTVALYINTSVHPCSDDEEKANAQAASASVKLAIETQLATKTQQDADPAAPTAEPAPQQEDPQVTQISTDTASAVAAITEQMTQTQNAIDALNAAISGAAKPAQ